MQYFFILGNNPSLSVAELTAFFDLEKKSKISNLNLVENILLFQSEENLAAQEIIHQLGGVIKIGIVIAEAAKNPMEILAKIKEKIEKKDKKFSFGFSNYVKGLNIKPVAMELKKHLKESGRSCRWVISRDPVLSSVVVEQNNLLKDGAEYVLISQGKQILIGQTLAVQPFKELSFRDYGRPARDDFSGMLPPKLAQIMLNLAKPEINGQIFDPSCGSGTILTEALLMGYKKVIGSDISAKAVADTEKNLAWIKEKFKIEIEPQVFNYDARKLSVNLPAESIDAIVTEPYLGPQRGPKELRSIVSELEELYAKSLLEFKKILKPHGRIVMVWPVFRSRTSGNIMLSKNIIGGLKIINPLPKQLSGHPNLTLSNRQTIIYGRADQKVWREIVILEK